MARYYRFSGWLPGVGTSMMIGSLHLLGAGGSRVDVGATISASVSPDSGLLSSLGTSAGVGCSFASSAARAAGFKIVIDCGTDVQASSVRLGTSTSSAISTWPCALTIESSNDLMAWTHKAAVPAGQSLAWPGLGGSTVVPFWMSDVTAPVVLLMPADTAVPLDMTGLNYPVLHGGAALSSVQSVSGGFSYRIPGEGSAIRVPTTADSPLYFGARDFTIGAKVRMNTVKVGNIFAWSGSPTLSWGDIQVCCRPSPSNSTKWRVVAFLRSSDTAYNQMPDILAEAMGPTDLSLNEWFSVELKRRSSSFELLVNGAIEVAATSAKPLRATVNSTGVIFGSGGLAPNGAVQDCMDGYIDEMVVVSGAAVELPAILPWPTTFSKRALGLVSSKAKVACAAPGISHSMRMFRVQTARDNEFGGQGRYPFKVEGLPTSQKARVTLLRARDRLVAREAWSGPDGSGEFTGLDLNTKFMAVAQDPSGLMHPVGAEHYPELPGGTP